MDEYLWFWLVSALFIGLGDLVWVVFLRRGPRKRKSDQLDDILFERNDKDQA